MGVIAAGGEGMWSPFRRRPLDVSNVNNVRNVKNVKNVNNVNNVNNDNKLRTEIANSGLSYSRLTTVMPAPPNWTCSSW